MLHYLSPKLLGPPESKTLFREHATEAHKWIAGEHARHAAAGDEKLRRRHRRLLTYFHSSVIGATPDRDEQIESDATQGA